MSFLSYLPLCRCTLRVWRVALVANPRLNSNWFSPGVPSHVPLVLLQITFMNILRRWLFRVIILLTFIALPCCYFPWLCDYVDRNRSSRILLIKYISLNSFVSVMYSICLAAFLGLAKFMAFVAFDCKIS